MAGRSLLDEMKAIQMARTYCLLAGVDPDEVVAGYFVDATGARQYVRKTRWRWYQEIAEAPEQRAQAGADALEQDG